MKLQIIIGSTRPSRAADRVAPWVSERASAHPAFEVEVLDLRDWPLPMFAEHFGTIGDFNDPTYSDPLVRAWNHKIKEADAYLVITPEYNHSVPGVLKNAIDSVWVSFAFRNKAIVAVGYSGGISGGVRAIEHLAQIAIEAELVPIRTAVVIPQVATAFDDDGQPVNPVTDISLRVALDDLAWWASALKQARAGGELRPAVFRVQAAAAAANQIEDEAV
ncbi:MAG: NADPH-dependent FMN reductase [Acidimicrobiales bacterium]